MPGAPAAVSRRRGPRPGPAWPGPHSRGSRRGLGGPSAARSWPRPWCGRPDRVASAPASQSRPGCPPRQAASPRQPPAGFLSPTLQWPRLAQPGRLTPLCLGRAGARAPEVIPQSPQPAGRRSAALPARPSRGSAGRGAANAAAAWHGGSGPIRARARQRAAAAAAAARRPLSGGQSPAAPAPARSGRPGRAAAAHRQSHWDRSGTRLGPPP